MQLQKLSTSNFRDKTLLNSTLTHIVPRKNKPRPLFHGHASCKNKTRIEGEKTESTTLLSDKIFTIRNKVGKGIKKESLNKIFSEKKAIFV